MWASEPADAPKRDEVGKGRNIAPQGPSTIDQPPANPRNYAGFRGRFANARSRREVVAVEKNEGEKISEVLLRAMQLDPEMAREALSNANRATPG